MYVCIVICQILLLCFFNREKSKRRTKTIGGTLEPKWEQTFMYAPMKRQDLKKHSLEITLYDYDRIGSGEYVGEVINYVFNCVCLFLCHVKEGIGHVIVCVCVID